MLRAAVIVEGQEGTGDDRAALLPCACGVLAVVAGGAGGMSGGAQAADQAVRTVAASLGDETPTPQGLAALLERTDHSLRAHPDCGEASAVVAAVLDGRVVGASVGDAQAVLHTLDRGLRILTSGQHRRPVLGSGEAVITSFEAPLDQGTLLLAGDGWYRFAPPGTLDALAGSAPPARLAADLVDRVRLPAGELQADAALVLVRRAAEARRARPEPVAAAGGRRLLVADRNAAFVQAAGRTYLKGAELVVVATGIEALARVDERPFDAVLVDEALGDMSGVELVTSLRARGYDGAIVAISARDDRNRQLLTAGAGAACSKMRFGEIGAVLERLRGGGA